MRSGVGDNLQSLQHLRDVPLDNGDPPATLFDPLLPGIEAHIALPAGAPRTSTLARRPAKLEDLAFADIDTLGALIHSRQVSCVELTTMFLARLHRLDATLHAVITFCDDRALAQASALDAELAAGHDRGPLHGIPWGAKDLLATKGVRTTWGAEPFETQMLPEDAEVVAPPRRRRRRALREALARRAGLGRRLVRRLHAQSVAARPGQQRLVGGPGLGGRGRRAALRDRQRDAGLDRLALVALRADFAAPDLRPRQPARRDDAELDDGQARPDDALGARRRAGLRGDPGRRPAGRDDRDASLPYAPPPRVDVKGWRVGYLEDDFPADSPDKGALDELRALGATLVPVTLPKAPIGDLLVILSAEAAEAFDRFTLDGQDDQLARQVDQAWPNVFRTSRLIPAVEYLRAQRVRRQLMLEMNKFMGGIDVLVHSSEDDAPLIIANLTGHPTVCAPCGFRKDGTPRSLSFTGHLYDEARLLAFVDAWQATTEWHSKHPAM